MVKSCSLYRTSIDKTLFCFSETRRDAPTTCERIPASNNAVLSNFIDWKLNELVYCIVNVVNSDSAYSNAIIECQLNELVLDFIQRNKNAVKFET